MKKIKGSIGYIDFYKKKYLRLSLIFLIIIIALYITGKIFPSKYFIYFAVLSALMILPASQQLSRYLVFSRYRSASKDYYEKLVEVDKKLVVYADLIIVYKKKTLFFDYIIITDRSIIGCYKQKNIIDAKTGIEGIYKQSGYNYPVIILENEEETLKYINKNIKNTLNNIDEKTQEKLSTIILQNSI